MPDLNEFRAKVTKKFPYGIQITLGDLDISGQVDDFTEVGGSPAILVATQAKVFRVVAADVQERGDRWVVKDDHGREMVLVPLTKEQGAILSDVLENQP